MYPWLKTLLVMILSAAANAVLPVVSGKIIGVDYNWKTIVVIGGSAAVTALVTYLSKSPLKEKEKTDEKTF